MSIRKRTWTKADGTEQTAWVVDYRDQEGRRCLKTFKRKKEADEFTHTAHVEVREGRHTPASKSLTVGEVADLWLDHCKAEGLEHGTIVQREEHIRLHIKPFIGRAKLADLSAPRVQTFIDELRDAGRSLAMRRKVLTNLKTLLSYAHGRGHVAQNVARSVRIRANGRDESHDLRPGVEMPTKQELRVMMDKAPPRWRPFIVTAVFTGMRASELRGLRWQDVDLEDGVVHVRQRADAWGNIGRPKSKAGARSIPLAPMVINTLREWRLACPPSAADLVFPNKRGNLMSHANFLNRAYYPLQIAMGLEVERKDDDGNILRDDDGKPIMRARYGFHALRHAAVSLFIEQGWSPKKVQTIIGHASIAMTFDRYGKLFKDQGSDRKAMERVEAALLTG